jgi:hypothetical protein
MRGYTDILNPTLTSGTDYEVSVARYPQCQISIACDQPFSFGGAAGTLFPVQPLADGLNAVIMDVAWFPSRDGTLYIECDDTPTVLAVMVSVVS